MYNIIVSEVKEYMRILANNSNVDLDTLVNTMDYEPIIQIIEKHLNKKLLIPSIGEIVYLSDDRENLIIFLFANFDINLNCNFDTNWAKVYFKEILQFCAIC